MESLAYLVVMIFLIQLLIGVATLTFAILFRKTKKFRLTSILLIAFLGIETLWAYVTVPAFAMASAVFLVSAALVRFLKTA